MRVAAAAPDFSDWASLLSLLQASFAYMDGRIDPPSSLTRMGVNELRAQADRENLILATEGAELVGCAYAGIRKDCVYVGKVAVAEHARGRGISRQLMAVAESIARKNGRDTLELQTRVELTENHRTFAALGFEKVGETSHPGYTRPTSIVMRKRVKP